MVTHWVRSIRHRYFKHLCFVIMISSVYVTWIFVSPNFMVILNNRLNIVKDAASATNDNGITTHYSSDNKDQKRKDDKSNVVTNSTYSRTKYILLWTDPKDSPFIYLGTGKTIFNNKKCKWNNCYVTGDRNYLGLFTTDFDAVLFNGARLEEIYSTFDIPLRRSAHQKYVYANIESPVNYPVKSDLWNEFFNWTWTYRLDSDSLWAYIAIRNATGQVIGPSVNMKWMRLSEMGEVDPELKHDLNTKSKAAAWFSSNCYTLSRREFYVKKIQKELRYHGLDVDVYGGCGNFKCPRSTMDKCLDILKKDYFFYFAFENSLSEDYVTEKIAYALNHNTVPVVYGGANYSRFMPDGIYLDALKLGPKKLAQTISKLMDNPEQYHEFFKWKKHYSYHFRSDSPDTDDYCRFCEVLHDKKLMETTTVYSDFDVWWSTNVSVTVFLNESYSEEIFRYKL